MQIGRQLTDDAVLAELGGRLERTRLERNLTQRELAAEAGVERKALQRIEAGESVKLTSLIRVLRALDLLDALDRLVPEPTPSPIELLKLQGKRRRRASGKRLHKDGPARAERTGPWHWGDEPADEQSAGDEPAPRRGAEPPRAQSPGGEPPGGKPPAADST